MVCCVVFNFYMLILELKLSTDALTPKHIIEMCLFGAPSKHSGASVSAAMCEKFLWFLFLQANSRRCSRRQALFLQGKIFSSSLNF